MISSENWDHKDFSLHALLLGNEKPIVYKLYPRDITKLTYKTSSQYEQVLSYK